MSIKDYLRFSFSEIDSVRFAHLLVPRENPNQNFTITKTLFNSRFQKSSLRSQDDSFNSPRAFDFVDFNRLLTHFTLQIPFQRSFIDSIAYSPMVTFIFDSRENGISASLETNSLSINCFNRQRRLYPDSLHAVGTDFLCRTK